MKLISECSIEELRQELFIYHHLSAGDQLANRKKYTILIDEMARRGVYEPVALPFDDSTMKTLPISLYDEIKALIDDLATREDDAEEDRLYSYMIDLVKQVKVLKAKLDSVNPSSDTQT